MVAGIGTTTAARADEIVDALRTTCDRMGVDLRHLALLAGLGREATDAALRDTAEQLRVPTRLFTLGALGAESARCLTNSERSLAATGIPSVAEAAALAGAGPSGTLLGPRQRFAAVTVALAETPEIAP